ncbi:MAG: hypothetical protein RLY20_1171 [Verrucomicrobiota bacterium]|jgi:Tfp pilus assembly pilus retraction ATPase PilT
MNLEQFNSLLAAMTEGRDGLSDIIFIPVRPPQIACYERLNAFESDLAEKVVSQGFTEQVAALLMRGSERLAEHLRTDGSCDCSHELPTGNRFRVNVYRQAGTDARARDAQIAKRHPAVGEPRAPARLQ